jgi:hypothetical protein
MSARAEHPAPIGRDDVETGIAAVGRHAFSGVPQRTARTVQDADALWKWARRALGVSS